MASGLCSGRRARWRRGWSAKRASSRPTSRVWRRSCTIWRRRIRTVGNTSTRSFGQGREDKGEMMVGSGRHYPSLDLEAHMYRSPAWLDTRSRDGARWKCTPPETRPADSYHRAPSGHDSRSRGRMSSTWRRRSHNRASGGPIMPCHPTSVVMRAAIEWGTPVAGSIKTCTVG